MLYAGLFIAVVAVLAFLRRQSRRKTDLFITAPRLKLMTVRLYEDGGRQLQLYAIKPTPRLKALGQAAG